MHGWVWRSGSESCLVGGCRNSVTAAGSANHSSFKWTTSSANGSVFSHQRLELSQSNGEETQFQRVQRRAKRARGEWEWRSDESKRAADTAAILTVDRVHIRRPFIHITFIYPYKTDMTTIQIDSYFVTFIGIYEWVNVCRVCIYFVTSAIIWTIEYQSPQTYPDTSAYVCLAALAWHSSLECCCSYCCCGCYLLTIAT